MKRLKILVSVYACEPNTGSEPGVGWNFCQELALHHEIWAVTRSSNRRKIEVEMFRNPNPNLHFVYFDLPRWARFWKRRGHGVYAYYFLWQLGILPLARRLQAEVGFDLVQHLTFVCYWMPSFLYILGPPFIWGPVGGGESVPCCLHDTLGVKERFYEQTRSMVRRLSEFNPWLRQAAGKSCLALATTDETAERLRALGARNVRVFPAVGLPASDIADLSMANEAPEGSIRFIGIGRLLAWKGNHFGLLAFARCGLYNAEYWVVGDGPDRRRLETLAQDLGIADRVTFFGNLPRPETLAKLKQCHVLVYPSLHDSGGWVSLEAMAAGKPVICLSLGGPALQISSEVGFPIPPGEPEQVIDSIAAAMARLGQDRDLRRMMGEHGRCRVKTCFAWSVKGAEMNSAYAVVLEGDTVSS